MNSICPMNFFRTTDATDTTIWKPGLNGLSYSVTETLDSFSLKFFESLQKALFKQFFNLTTGLPTSGQCFPNRHRCASQSVVFAESRLSNQNIKIDRPNSREKKGLVTSQSVLQRNVDK